MELSKVLKGEFDSSDFTDERLSEVLTELRQWFLLQSEDAPIDTNVINNFSDFLGNFSILSLRRCKFEVFPDMLEYLVKFNVDENEKFIAVNGKLNEELNGEMPNEFDKRNKIGEFKEVVAAT